MAVIGHWGITSVLLTQFSSLSKCNVLFHVTVFIILMSLIGAEEILREHFICLSWGNLTKMSHVS